MHIYYPTSLPRPPQIVSTPIAVPAAHKMVLSTPPPPHGDGRASARTTTTTPAILLSVSALLSLLTKRAIQVSKKLRPRDHSSKDHKASNYDSYEGSGAEAVKSPRTPRTPQGRRRPKELFTNVSNRAIKFVHGRKKGGPGEAGEDAEEDFGDGGVWQRAILMGDKCQPLDFSGVIYYDETGRKLDQLPLRSPRASPMPGYLDRRNR